LIKFDLDGGWRFSKRAYQGRALSHVYLTGDRSATNPSRPTTTSQTVTNPQRISPNINTSSSGSSSSSNNVIKELTFTAPDNTPNLAPQTVPNQSSIQKSLPPLGRNVRPSNFQPSLPPVERNVTQPTPQKALASLPTTNPGGYRNPNLLPPPPSPKIPRAVNSGIQSSNGLSPNNSAINASPSGVSYRVMASVSGQQQEQVRSLYPDAFATSYGGQRVLQVGVFSTQENATQAYQNLQNAGLRAIMIP
jgi:hypothetical protein